MPISSLLPSLLVKADEPRSRLAGSLRMMESGVVNEVNMVSANEGPGCEPGGRLAPEKRTWSLLRARRILPEFGPYSFRRSGLHEPSADKHGRQNDQD